MSSSRPIAEVSVRRAEVAGGPKAGIVGYRLVSATHAISLFNIGWNVTKGSRDRMVQCRALDQIIAKSTTMAAVSCLH